LTSSTRLPLLAGMFYPADAEELKDLITTCFASTVTSVSHPKGILVPHAGYIYSGPAAAVSYSRIDSAFNGTFVLIGTNHNGDETVAADISWQTPIGTVDCDTEFIATLPLQKDEIIIKRQENSLEVQMPFLCYRFPGAKIAPILIGDQSSAGAHMVAEAVLTAIKKTERKVIIFASGDCSHYVPKEKAQKDDLTTLEAVKNLDIEAFYRKLMELQPTMCGYGCIAAMAEICKADGAKEARLLTYTTSGDATGDYSEVVGYAAMEVI